MAQRAGTPWVRSCVPHASGIPGDRYLLPQPSGNSVKMQAEEVLVPQIRPDGAAAGLACLPAAPPHPTTETDRQGWLPPGKEVCSPLGVLPRTLPPLLPQEARPGEERLGAGSQRVFPLVISHPPTPSGVMIPATIISRGTVGFIRKLLRMNR